MNELKKQALKALSKKASYGPDIDLEKYITGIKGFSRIDYEEALSLAKEPAQRLGLSDREVKQLSYVQVNEKAFYDIVLEGLRRQGVIVLSTREALEKIPWAKEYYWRSIPVDKDKYTAAVELYGSGQGYFIYVPPGVKVRYPIYTCLLIMDDRQAQLVHNIVVVDEGAELNLITGCATSHRVRAALHIGVSEFYVKRNARLSFAMIHAWGEGIHVRPRTSVVVEEGGSYVSYYLVYSNVASLQQYPSIKLKRSAKLHSATIIMGVGDSIYDTGTEAVLEEEGATAEIVSRVLARDNSWIAARARIVAYHKDTRGHIECLGLPLSRNATIKALPELESRVEGAELTHEAAIGKIAEEEIEYLMSKGFTEEEARALILRGFLRVDVPGLPIATRRIIDHVTHLLAEKATG